MTIRELLSNKGLGLRELTIRYAKACWEQGWKPGMAKKLANPSNPFCGGPQQLLEAGITTLEGTDGPISITALSRIKFGKLSEAGKAVVGGVYGKNLSVINPTEHSGSDVIHQEYVETFEENVANSAKHFLNNGVSAAATVEAMLCIVLGTESTVEEGISAIQGLLANDNPKAQDVLNLASRASWIGRACQDGSWETSGDFILKDELLAPNAALDGYVVVPVLRYMLQDLKTKFEG